MQSHPRKILIPCTKQNKDITSYKNQTFCSWINSILFPWNKRLWCNILCALYADPETVIWHYQHPQFSEMSETKEEKKWPMVFGSWYNTLFVKQSLLYPNTLSKYLLCEGSSTYYVALWGMKGGGEGGVVSGEALPNIMRIVTKR